MREWCIAASTNAVTPGVVAPAKPAAALARISPAQAEIELTRTGLVKAVTKYVPEYSLFSLLFT